MFLIAGLGNPGTKYEHTRHNAGFDTIDALAEKYGIEIKKSERKALSGQGVINGEKVILIKPQTFMNLSGESVGDFVNFYKLDPETQFIVFSDDVITEKYHNKGSISIWTTFTLTIASNFLSYIVAAMVKRLTNYSTVLELMMENMNRNNHFYMKGKKVFEFIKIKLYFSEFFIYRN